MKQKLLGEWKKVFEADLPYIAREIRDTARAKAVIILEGPMGAGKTTFAKSFIDDGETYSPSYSVLSETGQTLHGDFYRIKDPEEIYHLELGLYLDEKNFFLVEWGEQFLSAINKELPEDFDLYKLDIKVNDQAQQETDQKKSFSRNFSLYKIEDL